MALRQPKTPTVSRGIPTTSYSRWRRCIIAIIGLSVLLSVMVPLATAIGSVHIPFLTTSSILFSRMPLINIEPTWPSTLETIILDIRLPRVILAGMVSFATRWLTPISWG